MTDSHKLIQETLVTKQENTDPEYLRLLAAYIDNPFYDITKATIEEYTQKKEIPTETA